MGVRSRRGSRRGESGAGWAARQRDAEARLADLRRSGSGRIRERWILVGPERRRRFDSRAKIRLAVVYPGPAPDARTRPRPQRQQPIHPTRVVAAPRRSRQSDFWQNVGMTRLPPRGSGSPTTGDHWQFGQRVGRVSRSRPRPRYLVCGASNGRTTRVLADRRCSRRQRTDGHRSGQSRGLIWAANASATLHLEDLDDAVSSSHRISPVP